MLTTAQIHYLELHTSYVSNCTLKSCVVLGPQVRELETELEAEQHRHVDTQKTQRKQDRRLQEVILQLDEGQKSQDRLKDMMDKLQQKNKQYKRQVEEAVSLCNIHGSFSSVVIASFHVMWHLRGIKDRRRDVPVVASIDVGLYCSFVLLSC